MVEVMIALGIGMVLACLLTNPRGGEQAATRPVPMVGVDVLPALPLLAPPLIPPAPAPDDAAPRKATQTAQRFK